MTTTQLELATSLNLPELNVLIELFWITSENRKMAYKMYLKGELLFQGKDFKPSPMFSADSLESIIALLGFLTCKPGDTDAEYFANYTPAQMDWANSFDCEQLGGLVSGYDSGEVDAVDYFFTLFNS